MHILMLSSRVVAFIALLLIFYFRIAKDDLYVLDGHIVVANI